LVELVSRRDWGRIREEALPIAEKSEAVDFVQVDASSLAAYAAASLHLDVFVDAVWAQSVLTGKQEATPIRPAIDGALKDAVELKGEEFAKWQLIARLVDVKSRLYTRREKPALWASVQTVPLTSPSLPTDRVVIWVVLFPATTAFGQRRRVRARRFLTVPLTLWKEWRDRRFV
jgi:hypothetical protein